MDESNFDKLIKQKLEGYEDPTFDEAALADFQHQLAAVKTVPWYGGSFTPYGVASVIALLTILSGYLLWKGDASATALAQSNLKIDSLTSALHDLRQLPVTIIQHDTVTVVKTRQVYVPSRYVTSSSEPDVIQTRPSLTLTKVNDGSADLIFLGPAHVIPSETVAALEEKHVLRVVDGSAYLQLPEQNGDPKLHADTQPDTQRNAQPVVEQVMAAETPSPMKMSEENREQEIQSAYEEPVQSRIAINIGPHVDVLAGQFSKGRGVVAPRLGFLAELVLPRSVSFEAGVDYSFTSINFNHDFQSIEIPNLDNNLGTINGANIKNDLLSVPLGIKYRKPISTNSVAVVRLGYTPYFSVRQQYQCGYEPSNRSTKYGYVNPVTSILREDHNFFYGNTTSISLGIVKTMKNKDKIEGSLFFEQSLSSMGNEQLRMSLLGLRTAFWLNVH